MYVVDISTRTNHSGRPSAKRRCEPERVSFVYNHMKSAIAFETQCVDAISKKGYQSLDKLELSKAVDQFSFEPDRVRRAFLLFEKIESTADFDNV